MNIRELIETSGYIARNAEEAKDPRYSASLTVDVKTDTMRKQLDAFYPTLAPDDGQTQIKEAEENIMSKQLKEGMGSVNVEQEYDLSRITKLAGLTNNNSNSTGTPVSERISDDIYSEKAIEIASELEQQVEQLTRALDEIEQTIKFHLPKEYAGMKDYTIAHIKAAIGGFGYAENRMSKSFASLIEDLNEHGDESDEDTL